MRTHSKGEERIVRPYCLRCYAAMERSGEASQHCERCGFVNVKLDQELFWTKEPRLVELEAWAKTLIVFLLLGIAVAMVVAMQRWPSYGLGQGWAIAFPILVGVILWDNASAITRRTSDFRATIVWRIVCSVLAPVPFLLAVDLGPRTAIGLALLALGVVLLAGALGLGRLGASVARWRTRHVLAGQSDRRAAAA